jgi:hypothetical protein
VILFQKQGGLSFSGLELQVFTDYPGSVTIDNPMIPVSYDEDYVALQENDGVVFLDVSDPGAWGPTTIPAAAIVDHITEASLSPWIQDSIYGRRTCQKSGDYVIARGRYLDGGTVEWAWTFFDITDSDNPSAVGDYVPEPGLTTSITMTALGLDQLVSGNIAVLVIGCSQPHNYWALKVVDLRSGFGSLTEYDWAAPVGETLDHPVFTALSGNRIVWIAERTAPTAVDVVRIYDLSDPSTLTLLGEDLTNQPNGPYDLVYAVGANHVWARTTTASTFDVWDCTGSTPVLDGTVALGVTPFGPFAFSGKYGVCKVAGTDDYRLYDFTDPLVPVLLDTLTDSDFTSVGTPVMTGTDRTVSIHGPSDQYAILGLVP